MAYESPDANYVTWIEAQGYAKAFAKDWAAEFGQGPKGGSEAGVPYPRADLGTRISELPDEMTMEAYTARESIRFLKQQLPDGQPFFLWSSFYRPHQPYNPLKTYLDMYDRHADLFEMTNIIEDPAAAAERDRMRSFFDEWVKRVPDTGKAELIQANDPTMGVNVRIVPDTGEGPARQRLSPEHNGGGHDNLLAEHLWSGSRAPRTCRGNSVRGGCRSPAIRARAHQ